MLGRRTSFALLLLIVAALCKETQGQGDGLFFNNIMVLNHGIVTREDIGTEAIQCWTTAADCCTDNDTNTGKWFRPNGNTVSTDTSRNWYQVKGPGYVYLHRQMSSSGEGIFHCEIGVTGSEETYYVGVYSSGSGAVTINDPIEFTLDSAVNAATLMFTMNCTSTGGPATTVNWTLDDSQSLDGGVSQITDQSTATYSNTLTVTGRTTGNYQCRVSNDRNTVTQMLTVTSASPPTGLGAILVKDTITVSWIPPSPTPTGYVIYYQATDGGADTGNIPIMDGNTDQFNITGRNRDNYDITIVATSDHLPSTVVGPVGTLSDGLFFNDAMVNHGIVTRESIGTSASNAVQCQTTVADCCTDSDANTGQWYFPTNDNYVLESTNFYQVKGPGYVYLHRKSSPITEGIFRCEIGPTGSSEVTETYYVGVYPSGSGAITISGQIQFSLLTDINAATPMFTLTCTSTGGPATTVTWTSLIGAGGTESQTVTDQRTATYSNTLTVTGRHTGDYMCSVSNARTASPATQTLSVTAASLPTRLRAIKDGTTITVSWTPPSPTPTGYVIYYLGGTDLGSRAVTGGSTDKQDIANRMSDIYEITIVATSDHLPSTVVGPVVTTRDGLFFNNVMVNHGIVTREAIGTEASNAIQCQTTVADCCTDSDANTGQWYFPTGHMISTDTNFYQEKGPGYVYLHGRNMPNAEGIFHCKIVMNGSEETYYVGVYPSGSGVVTINDPIQFTLDSAVNATTPMFTLICTSTGGPATTVTWTSLIGAGGTKSQTVTDQRTATYSNTLTVTGRHTGDYMCSVSNARTARPATRTLTVTAAGPPTDVSATQEGSTITVSWTPPTTGTIPTGYMIYYQATGNQGSVMVNSGSATQKLITDRQANHVYTVTMVTLSNQLPSTNTTAVTAIRPVAYIELNGRMLPNNSLVTLTEIGTTRPTSLRCVTARTDCCSGVTDEDTTDWFDPRGGLATQLSTFTRSRTGEGDPLGYVQLHRSSSSATLSPANEGIYRCIIPEPGSDMNPEIATLYVGIYNTDNGAVSVTDPIQFSLDSAVNADPPVFTLTCISTGGPATTVTWTLNGSEVTYDVNYVLTQIVVNTETAEYSNTLTVTGRESGNYQCSVGNARESDTSQQLIVQAPDPPTVLSALHNSPTTIQVYWTAPTTPNNSLPINGYEITLFAGVGDDTGTVIAVISGSATSHSITDLQSTVTYRVSVVSVNSYSLSSSVGPVLVTRGPGLAHKGSVLPNHSLLTRDPAIIGEDDDAVYCVTDDATCCGTPTAGNGRGNWYFPSGIILSMAIRWYATWTTGAVLMNFRGTAAQGGTGLFRCDIKDSENNAHQFYLGVYATREGALSITGSIQFTLNLAPNATSPMFTLTCTSTGGPATTVTWTSPAEASGIESQTVTDQSTATYSNTLTMSGRFIGDYMCSVSNARTASPAIRTLTVTAAGPPTDVSATQEGSTITVSWTPPTMGTIPTGYVVYYQATGDQGSVIVNSGSATQKLITDRQANRVYTITMVTLSNQLPSTKTIAVTAIRPVYIELSGTVLSNNCLVTLPEIGTTGATSLRCVTARTDCCSGATDEDTTNWFDPRGRLAIQLSTFTRSRAGEGDPLGYVQLHRTSSSATLSTANEGIYSCIIPEPGSDMNPEIATLYVGIYNTDNGAVSVTDPIQFSLDSAVNADPPVFTLTCISTGGPATTVTWTLNGSEVTYDVSHVLTQTVINTETAEYNNTLTVIGRDSGNYQCSVGNARGSDSSQQLTVQAPDPPTVLSALHSSPTTIQVYWTAPTTPNNGLPINGYKITLFAGVGNDTGTVTTVISGSATSHSITNLQSTVTYRVSVVSVNSYSQSSSVGPVLVARGPGLAHKGSVLPNHSLLTRDPAIIGEDDDAVYCVTDDATCCGTPTAGNERGNWYFPTVRVLSTGIRWYATWTTGAVLMNFRGTAAQGVAGLFRCNIKDNENNVHQFYLGVYATGEGGPSITGSIQFTLDSAPNASKPVFTLTCTSTGGPATTVTWTSPAGAGGTESQIVTDQRTATYSNTLTVTGRHTGDYMCSVSNARTASPVTQTLSVTAANPPTGLRAIKDDSTITVSWTPPSSTPTGYVIYWQATDGGTDSGSRTVNGGSTDQFNITGRNHDSYDITIVATSNHLPSTVVGPVDTRIPPDPILVSISSSGSGVAGSTYTLTCTVSEDITGLTGSPTVHWVIPSGLAGYIVEGSPSTGDQTSTLTLTFSPLLTSHGRYEYTCLGMLSSPAVDGDITATKSSTVTVIIPQPSVVITLDTQPPYIGTVHSLMCTIELDPSVDTSVTVSGVWSTGGGELEDSNGCLDISDTTSTGSSTYETTLTFIPLLSNSTGQYSCDATAVPSDSTYVMDTSNSGDYQLTVQDLPPPVISYTTPGTPILPGQPYTLTCTAEIAENVFGDNPTLQWLNGNGRIIPESSDTSVGSLTVIDNTATLELTFTSFESRHVGDYICQGCIDISKASITSLCSSVTVITTISGPCPTAIQDLAVHVQSDSRVTIIWREPAQPQGDIIGYKVDLKQYVSGAQGVVTQSLDGFPLTTLETTLNHDTLMAGVPYEVTVRASNIVCYGESTSSEIFFTSEGIPAKVGDVSVDRTSGTSITVRWTRLTIVEAKGVIAGYIIEYKPADNKKRQIQQVEAGPDESAVVIQNLNPSVAYSVIVYATSGGGQSVSNPVTVPPHGIQSPSSSPIAIIIGAVVAVVVIIVVIIVIVIAIIVAMWLVFRHKQVMVSLQKGTGGEAHWNEASNPKVISVSGCAAYGTVPATQQTTGDTHDYEVIPMGLLPPQLPARAPKPPDPEYELIPTSTSDEELKTATTQGAISSTPQQTEEGHLYECADTASPPATAPSAAADDTHTRLS